MKPTEFNDPNLIDFPCSYAWRVYYEETIYGRYLPPIEPTQEPKILPRTPPIQHKELQQIKGLVLHLQGKLNEHLDKKKKDVY